MDEETQIVNVETPFCPGAQCLLENSNGKLIVKNTPETLTIHKSAGDLMVKCTKDEHVQVDVFESSANTAMWGNLLFGGIIGAAIDWQDSGFDYESVIVNSLRCGDEEAEKAAVFVKAESSNQEAEATKGERLDSYEQCREKISGRVPDEWCERYK